MTGPCQSRRGPVLCSRRRGAVVESVRYRGGWEAFFRTVALIATPAAVAVNLLILLLA
jgi:hypothetical protein